MFSYPARVARDGGGYLVTFPDIPEAMTGAKAVSYTHLTLPTKA